jgi:hypothetical protein
LKHFSDATFLGKLLVLPANVRLYWKVIARYKHSSLFGLVVSNEEKKFCKKIVSARKLVHQSDEEILFHEVAADDARPDWRRKWKLNKTRQPGFKTEPAKPVFCD